MRWILRQLWRVPRTFWIIVKWNPFLGLVVVYLVFQLLRIINPSLNQYSWIVTSVYLLAFVVWMLVTLLMPTLPKRVYQKISKWLNQLRIKCVLVLGGFSTEKAVLIFLNTQNCRALCKTVYIESGGEYEFSLGEYGSLHLKNIAGKESVRWNYWKDQERLPHTFAEMESYIRRRMGF